ncbi:MAG: hypothetical protein ACRER2_17990 [Methylococcales bacterium]
MAEELSIYKSTVSRALREAAEKGLLEKPNGDKKAAKNARQKRADVDD